MKSIEIKVFPRTITGKKGSKSLRKDNQVPCVLYGGKENIHFYAEDKAFKNIVYTNHAFLVKFDVDSKKVNAVMKEIQFHPVTDSILHIDFLEVIPGKDIVVDLPVEITGSSAGVRAGGKLRQRKRYIRVKGQINNIPDSIVIDISDLEIGQSVFAGDIKYDNVQVVDPLRAMVVGVISARAAAKAAEEEAGAAGKPAAGTEGAKAEGEKSEG